MATTKPTFVNRILAALATPSPAPPPKPCNADLGGLRCPSTGQHCPYPHLDPIGGPYACRALMTR